MLAVKLESIIRDVPDFPKPGILFKDITPIFENAALCSEIVDKYISVLNGIRLDAIVGVESRGFFFGFLLANKLGIPFIPVRKSGKLPYKTISAEYALEYGTAKIEMHIDAIKPGWNVLIHDDLLATGGTACAAADLVLQQRGKIAGFAFLVALTFLNGQPKLAQYSNQIHSLVSY